MEISKEQIQEWKNKYGKVRKISINDTEHFYRGITLDEYYNIDRLTSDGQTQPEVETVKVGLLHPKLAENPSAGLVIKLSDEILKLSGFDNKDAQPEEL